MDITQLILDDHNEQRRLFAILEQIGPDDIPALSAIWDRLGAFLELHAAAEEAVFYPALLEVGLAARRKEGAEAETLDAIRDHNEIRDAVGEAARHPVGSAEWFAAVAAANLFTTFQARNYTGVTAIDRDPETYIRQAEGRPPQVPGSLDIGGLKQE